MITLGSMMAELFDNSCSNPAYSDGTPGAPNYGLTYGDPEDAGYNRYGVELHCRRYIITARKATNSATGVEYWDIKKFEKQDS